MSTCAPRRFNVYVLFALEYCANVGMSSAEPHLVLLNSAGRSAERLCEGELCCLGHRMEVSALCLLYIHPSVDHLMKQCPHYFVAARNTSDSAALGELALVIPRCRTDQLCRSFLPTTLYL